MPTLPQVIDDLCAKTVKKRQSLDDALFALQTWIDRNVPMMSEADRTQFSNVLNAEKDSQVRDGQPFGDDASLISSVLRLHAMRLIYRYDDKQRGPIPLEDDSPYGRGRHRLQVSLHEAEMALNEARVDAAIANAHHILADRGANRRWLQDALSRLQTAASKNLVRLADAIPAPELPPLNIVQRLAFLLLGIKQEEIGRRSLQSLRHVAELQRSQLTEMATLLAESFQAIDDGPGAQQAMALLKQIDT